jgi:hypothetical protein
LLGRRRDLGWLCRLLPAMTAKIVAAQAAQAPTPKR